MPALYLHIYFPFFFRELLSKQKYERINKALAVMCGSDLRPISIVNGRGFQTFVHELNSEYKVPSTNTVVKYMHVVYGELKAEVMEVLAGCSVAITTDMWTSVATRGYITVTAHCIDREWKLISKVVATRPVDERHTGVNIAAHINAIQEEFGMKSVTALVSDNAANMVTAAKEAKLIHVRCFAHTLQLAIHEGIKSATIARVSAAGRRMVTHFHHSALATNALLDEQKRRNPGKKTVHLVQDVVTRWNSTYLMMKRIQDLKLSLFSVLLDDTITKPADRKMLDMTDRDWAVMDDVIPILEPLAEATELLTKEDMPTSSCVFLLLASLLESMEANELDSTTAKALKKNISDSLRRRFRVDGNNQPSQESLTEPFMVAAALDPRYKAMNFLAPEKREIVHDYIIQLMDNLEVPARPVKEEKDEMPPEPSTKRRLLDALKGDIVDLTGPSQADQTTEHELESYITSPVNVSDPLLWWKVNAAQFPRLSQIAQIYLAIPATEVPSERVFSAAGLTITKLRASLDPSNADELIFIHKNYRFATEKPRVTPTHSAAPVNLGPRQVPAVDMPSTSSNNKDVPFARDGPKALDRPVLPTLKQESDISD